MISIHAIVSSRAQMLIKIQTQRKCSPMDLVYPGIGFPRGNQSQSREHRKRSMIGEQITSLSDFVSFGYLWDSQVRVYNQKLGIQVWLSRERTVMHTYIFLLGTKETLAEDNCTERVCFRLKREWDHNRQMNL